MRPPVKKYRSQLRPTTVASSVPHVEHTRRCERARGGGRIVVHQNASTTSRGSRKLISRVLALRNIFSLSAEIPIPTLRVALCMSLTPPAVLQIKVKLCYITNRCFLFFFASGAGTFTSTTSTIQQSNVRGVRGGIHVSMCTHREVWRSSAGI